MIPMLRFFPLLTCIISLVVTAKGLRLGKIPVANLPGFGITCGATVFAIGLLVLVTAIHFHRKLKPHALDYVLILLTCTTTAAMPGPLLYFSIMADGSFINNVVILAFLSTTAVLCWPANKGGKAPPPHTLR